MKILQKLSFFTKCQKAKVDELSAAEIAQNFSVGRLMHSRSARIDLTRCLKNGRVSHQKLAAYASLHSQAKLETERALLRNIFWSAFDHSPATQAELQLIECVAALKQIHLEMLKKPEGRFVLELRDWFEVATNRITEEALATSDRCRIWELSCLLTKLQTPQASILMRRMPKFAKDFVANLEKAAVLGPSGMRQAIGSIHQSERLFVLACLINCQLLDVDHLSTFSLVKAEKLSELASHITHLEILDGNINSELKTALLQKCSKLIYLRIAHFSALNLPEHMSQLRVLIATNCSTGALSIPHPHLERLDIIDCNNLSSLSLDSAQLLALNISGAQGLTSLTFQTQKLERLALINCPLLDIQLPAMPSLESFTVQRCLHLRISTLPERCRLDLDPGYLPGDVLTTSALQLEKEPARLFEKLRPFFLHQAAFPNIRYESEETGVLPSYGDGLKRDFVASLLRALFATEQDALPLEMQEEFCWPIYKDNPLDKLYLQVLGSLLARCFFHNTDRDLELKAGQHFSVLFFEILQLIATAAPTLPNSFYLKAECLLLGIGQVSGEVAEVLGFEAHEIDAAKDELINRGKRDPRLQALIIVGTAFGSELSSEGAAALIALSAEEIQKQIQGELSTDLLLSALDYSSNTKSSSATRATRRYLEKWILEHPDKLSDFVKATTGSRTLGRRKIAVKYLEDGVSRYPTASTCHCILHLPTDCSSQGMFNERLSHLLLAEFELA